MNSDSSLPLERHPFEPFAPEGAKALIMGTFPPKPVRWSMEFYYPNKINDFWRIMGMIYFGDRDAFINVADGSFMLPRIKEFLVSKGIALSDTGAAVRRLRDNASDKFLEIVEPVDLKALLDRMPHCRFLATTGEKAAGVLAEVTSSLPPKMGGKVEAEFDGRKLEIWRLPSTSRAYPLSIAAKAEYYKTFLLASSCLTL